MTSTGIYRFPIERATQIAVEETQRFLSENSTLQKVIFVCFNEAIRSIYLQTLEDN